VEKSNNPEYPEGTKVVGNFGWRDSTIHKPEAVDKNKTNFEAMYKMPDLKGLPESYALGAVGLTG